MDTKFKRAEKPKIFEGPDDKLATFRRVFLSPDGQRVLEDMRVAARWYQGDAGLTETEIVYNAGRRDDIRYILSNLTTELEIIE